MGFIQWIFACGMRSDNIKAGCIFNFVSGAKFTSRRCCLAQEVRMGDMRTKQQVAEVLSAYHPFWLRLGLEVVVGKPVPKQAAGSSLTNRAELEEFAHVHFLGDADLALQRAGNRAIIGLHSPEYWVGVLTPQFLEP